MSKNKDKLPEHLQPIEGIEKFEPGNLSERTKDLLAKEFGDEDGDTQQVDALEEAILSNQPIQVNNSGYIANIPQAATTAEELIPTLKNLFEGKDYLIKEFFPNGITDIIDYGEQLDGNKIRVKKIVEPEDIYDDRLDPRKERLLYEFLFGQLRHPGQAGKKTVGDEIAIAVKRMATTSGTPVVAWLRQKMWAVLAKNKVRALEGVPQDRTEADDLDEPKDLRNIKLRMLVEWSNYEQLQDLGRLNKCSNVTAFIYMLKWAHDKMYVDWDRDYALNH